MTIVSINILFDKKFEIILSNHSRTVRIHKAFDDLSEPTLTDWIILKSVFLGWLKLMGKTYYGNNVGTISSFE
jgi:hypothetical protein